MPESFAASVQLPSTCCSAKLRETVCATFSSLSCKKHCGRRGGTLNNGKYLQGFSVLQSTKNKSPSFRSDWAAASHESPWLPWRAGRECRGLQQLPLASSRDAALATAAAPTGCYWEVLAEPLSYRRVLKEPL